MVHAPFADLGYTRGGCRAAAKAAFSTDALHACVEAHGRSLADEVAGELTRQGFLPLRGDARPAPTTVEVHGAAHHVFHADGLTIAPELSARLLVTTPNGLRAERRFYLRGEAMSSFSGEHEIVSAVNGVRQRIARSMIAALTELLDLYPELGAPGASAPRIPLEER